MKGRIGRNDGPVKVLLIKSGHLVGYGEEKQTNLQARQMKGQIASETPNAIVCRAGKEAESRRKKQTLASGLTLY